MSDLFDLVDTAFDFEGSFYFSEDFTLVLSCFFSSCFAVWAFATGFCSIFFLSSFTSGLGWALGFSICSIRVWAQRGADLSQLRDFLTSGFDFSFLFLEASLWVETHQVGVLSTIGLSFLTSSFTLGSLSYLIVWDLLVGVLLGTLAGVFDVVCRAGAFAPLVCQGSALVFSTLTSLS